MNKTKTPRRLSTRWKDFEALIENIQAELVPEAVVRRDEKVRGRSGRLRQLDVTIRKTIGPYPILIVVECRQYSRPVTIDKVEAFATKLHDVDAYRGVIVASSGFDAGAKACAAQHNIILQNYREATLTDFVDMLQEKWWLTFLFVRPYGLEATAVLDDSVDIPLTRDSFLLDDSDEPMPVARISEFILQSAKSMTPGSFEIVAELDGSIFVEVEGRKRRVMSLAISGTRRLFESAVNLHPVTGHILIDAGNGRRLFRQAVGEGIDWAQLIRTCPTREISEEEWTKSYKEVASQRLYCEPESMKKYIRIVATESAHVA